MKWPLFYEVFQGSVLNRVLWNFPNLRRALPDWQVHGNFRRLWHRDTTFWKGQDKARWIGWITW